MPSSLPSFVRSSTHLRPAPFVPEILLHLADEAYGLWESTEQRAGQTGLPPPFWAFVWPGGQGLARHVLDSPGVVTGRRVLDLASGCGLVAVAAARSGAAAVTANDIDPLALAAIDLNAQANGVQVEVVGADLLGTALDGHDVILVGDVFYQREMAATMLATLDAARARGATVLVGDPGRTYLPVGRFCQVADYVVPTIADLEDSPFKRTAVWSLTDR